MKVAHLTTVDMSLRFLVFAQLQSVSELGAEPIGISAPGPWTSELEEAGVIHLPLESSTRGVDVVSDLRSMGELWRHLRRSRPDILHTHNPKTGLYGRILGRLAGVPIVVNTVHGLYAAPDDPWIKRLIVYVLEALASRFSDAELVQSSEDLALLRRWRIAPAGRATYLGNGVDLDRFDPDNPARRNRAAMRAELGAREEDVVVGIVGRLVAEKGFPEFFEAVTDLPDNYRVVVVGPEDPTKPDAVPTEMIAEARRNGVVFLGMRSDVDDLYGAMDVFVLPSHREGFPRAAMEASAMGVPVVATDIRGCREVVDHGVNGLLVPVNDPASLRAAIRELGDDADLRNRMRTASREKAKTSFDEQRVVQRVIETYRRVAAEKGLTELTDKLGAHGVDASLREAVAEDAPVLARMHMDGISTGFLPQLGHRFMTRLYRALLAWPGAVIQVADAGGPVGFVAGVEDTDAFYSAFYRRHGGGAVMDALPSLVRPSVLRRAWETARYSHNHTSGATAAKAELLSMAVAPTHRRQGLGRRLGEEFLHEMADRGAAPVRVVVGAENEAAAAAYRKMGFVDAGAMEVHPGERSLVLEWPG